MCVDFFRLKILSIKYFKRIKDTRIMILNLVWIIQPGNHKNKQRSSEHILSSTILIQKTRFLWSFATQNALLSASLHPFSSFAFFGSLDSPIHTGSEPHQGPLRLCCSVNQSRLVWSAPEVPSQFPSGARFWGKTLGCFNLDKRNPNHKYKGQSRKQNPECESFTGTGIQMFCRSRVSARLTSC